MEAWVDEGGLQLGCRALLKHWGDSGADVLFSRLPARASGGCYKRLSLGSPGGSVMLSRSLLPIPCVQPLDPKIPCLKTGGKDGVG